MPEATPVLRNDLASGKFARVFSGATDLTAEDPTSDKRPARAIVAQGAVSIVGTDNVQVDLPDLGNFWWDIQTSEIVSGDGVAIW